MYILTSKYFPTDYWPDLYFPALPEGADIQYTEVVEFSLVAVLSAEFDVVLPNDVTLPVNTGLVGAVTVSGAGSNVVNGVYQTNGVFNNKTTYIKEAGVYILWLGSINPYWLMNASGVSYYRSYDDVVTPDLCTTWVVSTGSLPVPTVTSTNPISGISVTAAFTLEMPMVITMEVYEELSA